MSNLHQGRLPPPGLRRSNYRVRAAARSETAPHENFAFIEGHVKWYTKGAGPFAAGYRAGAAPGTCEVPAQPPSGDGPPRADAGTARIQTAYRSVTVPMRRRQSRRGFTLIELLTVIGIIAVLAAILFPVFSRARASARRTRCLSNMQQLGVAIETYVQDNAGFLPPWSITHPGINPWTPPPDPIKNVADPSVATWDTAIMYALRTKDLLICPDNPNSDARSARSYAIAQYTQRPMRLPSGGIIAIGGFRDDIPAPQKTVLLFEKGDNEPGAWGDALGQNVYQYHDETPDQDQMWHFNGKDFLYCDYHAKWESKNAGPFTHEGDGETDDVWDGAGTCEEWGRITNGGDWPDPD